MLEYLPVRLVFCFVFRGVLPSILVGSASIVLFLDKLYIHVIIIYTFYQLGWGFNLPNWLLLYLTQSDKSMEERSNKFFHGNVPPFSTLEKTDIIFVYYLLSTCSRELFRKQLMLLFNCVWILAQGRREENLLKTRVLICSFSRKVRGGCKEDTLLLDWFLVSCYLLFTHSD